jgi:F-type H+-transporting ATPase subunit epsilon
MADATTKSLQVVVVTPEKAVLDEAADMVILPMFDGELGVLPRRAPLIGRLGKGTLRIKRGGATKTFTLAGGFAQVRADVVTVLTPKVTAV